MKKKSGFKKIDTNKYKSAEDVSEATFDWKEHSEAKAWAISESKKGKKIYIDDTGDDSYLLFSAPSKEAVLQSLKVRKLEPFGEIVQIKNVKTLDNM